LIVVEDKDLSDLLRMYLEARHGAEVDVALDGEAALELCQLHDYDVMLLGIMLPGMSGFEIFDSLRRSGNDTPVVFLTACDEHVSELIGLGMGAVDYMPKPFKLRALATRLRHVLQLAR
jgi:OmpR-family two-component system manganese-sensing response regulator